MTSLLTGPAGADAEEGAAAAAGGPGPALPVPATVRVQTHRPHALRPAPAGLPADPGPTRAAAALQSLAGGARPQPAAVPRAAAVLGPA